MNGIGKIDDMEKYAAIYKCRLCGEEFEYCYTGKSNAEITSIELALMESNQHINYAMTLNKYITHYCKDESFGIAEFQGFRRIEDGKEM